MTNAGPRELALFLQPNFQSRLLSFFQSKIVVEIVVEQDIITEQNNYRAKAIIEQNYQRANEYRRSKELCAFAARRDRRPTVWRGQCHLPRGRQTFLCLWLGREGQDWKGAPRFACKLPPDRNETLRLQYEAVTPAFHWNKKHWSDVYYEQLATPLVRDWIRESHDLVVSKLPKVLRAKYL